MRGPGDDVRAAPVKRARAAALSAEAKHAAYTRVAGWPLGAAEAAQAKEANVVATGQQYTLPGVCEMRGAGAWLSMWGYTSSNFLYGGG